jgi:hypothetical protein
MYQFDCPICEQRDRWFLHTPIYSIAELHGEVLGIELAAPFFETLQAMERKASQSSSYVLGVYRLDLTQAASE